MFPFRTCVPKIRKNSSERNPKSIRCAFSLSGPIQARFWLECGFPLRHLHPSRTARPNDQFDTVNVTDFELELSKLSTTTNAAVCDPGVRVVEIFN